MSLIQDIILTTMDAWGLLYLVSVEETSKKENFILLLYISLYFVLLRLFLLFLIWV